MIFLFLIALLLFIIDIFHEIFIVFFFYYKLLLILFHFLNVLLTVRLIGIDFYYVKSKFNPYTGNIIIILNFKILTPSLQLYLTTMFSFIVWSFILVNSFPCFNFCLKNSDKCRWVPILQTSVFRIFFSVSFELK